MSASLSRLCVVFGLMGFVVSSGAWGRTIYVDDDATADSDGSAWGQAYRDLQSALDVAKPGDEIRVAGGVYRPSKGLLTFASVRYATFSLISGVALRGGFAGPAGADPNARDVARFETILSGDLDGDDAGGQINGDNCFNVCTGDYTDPNAILDGFVIEGGAGGGWSAGTMSGGGLTIYRGRPTIANCTFRLNYAQDRGGAVVSYQSSGAFIDCTFVENTASWAGGAVEVYAGEPRFIGCDFIRNSVDGRNQGGAVFIVGLSRPEFTHCRFIANRATFGGAVKNEQSTSIFANCLFAGNRAYDEAYALLAASWEIGDPRSSAAGPSGSELPARWTRRGGGGAGGAISNSTGGVLTLASCTVTDNSSDSRGGVTSGPDCSCTFVNCALWGNSERSVTARPSQIPNSGVSAFYCCIQNPPKDLPGMGNTAGDPAFVRPGRWADPIDPSLDGSPTDMAAQWIDGDYHLRSQAGRWDPNSEAWVLDEITSSCIDAGDPNSPVGDEPQPNGGRINLGAYGGTVEASKSFLRPEESDE